MDRNGTRKIRRRQATIGILQTVTFVVIATLILALLFKESNNSRLSINEQDIKMRSLAVTPKSMSQSATIAAIGDILIHDWVYKDAKTNNGYDFHPMFDQMTPMLQQPDLLLANQETILGGEALGISSYPMFNSPVEIGNAVMDAGVDIVSTSNNHSLDRKEEGVLASLAQLDAIGLPHVGTYASLRDKQTLTVLEKNGITIAYLSYTYGTNGMPIPAGKSYLVNLIDHAAMSEEIKRAKQQADLVVMSIHWGNEYQRYPSEDQKELAQFLVDQGVNVIFGHHPHVLQPMEWLKNSAGENALVVYSLGNFLSGQMKDYKDIGGMASVQVTKVVNQDGTSIQLSNPNFFPTYVSNQHFKHYQVVPLQAAGRYGLKNSQEMYENIMNHMLGSVLLPQQP